MKATKVLKATGYTSIISFICGVVSGCGVLTLVGFTLGFFSLVLAVSCYNDIAKESTNK